MKQYYYLSGYQQPVAVIMNDKYKASIHENIDYQYFIVHVETSNIDLLREINLMLRNFAKRKRNY